MSNGMPVIAIDPGHNVRPDTGASYGTYSEDGIVLGVAQQLALICKDRGIKTINCLPKSAISVVDSLNHRCSLSNAGGATIYVSIHCNAATPTTGARGSETYAISTAGKAIAANIQREYTKLGFKDRGVKATLDGGSPPYVLRHTNAIAVLTEICFLDSTEDMAIFNSKGLKAIAQAIFNGLTHGMNFDTQPDNHDNDPVAQVKPSLLVNAAKWYKGLPHQEAAFRALEGVLTSTQLQNFKVAYSPESVKSEPVKVRATTGVKPSVGIQTVADWIKSGNGSTSGVDGLSDQIIKAMGDVGLVKFTHPRFVVGENCDPYFHVIVAHKLQTTLDKCPGLQMRCNSAYRSPVRQLVLREFYDRGIHGVTAAARVGTGNHEKGLAIDIENHEEWRSILVDSGWQWQGPNDRMHFDVDIQSNIPRLAITAFQKLANRNGCQCAIDGLWGEETKKIMLSAPAKGWSKG